MKFKPKNLEDQVIVITGATSGIGLVTARKAAERGAKVVLASRNEEALRKLADEINGNGGEATWADADVASEEDVLKIAAEALSKFGTIDTWVNNAGVSIYGKIEEVPLEDSKQLFETNFWGVVNGSVIAARNMKTTGGTIINIGSTLSDRAIPIQGMYCASKHAVKGFTDAFRMELEAENAPVCVTLVKPGAIDTPYIDHAKSYLGVDPINPPPVYAPETAADVILHCAEHPVRDAFVGAGGKMISLLGKIAPRSTDLIMENTMIEMQKSDESKERRLESLYESNDSRLAERGGYPGHVAESSLYSKAAMHPVITGTAIAIGAFGAGGLVYGLTRTAKRARSSSERESLRTSQENRTSQVHNQ